MPLRAENPATATLAAPKPPLRAPRTLAELDPLLMDLRRPLPALKSPSPLSLFLPPSPLTPIPGADWAKRPDPEDTREDIDAALDAILGDSRQQPTVSTFVAPPPGQPATSDDWSAAVNAISAANPADPSVPFSDWEPTLSATAPASLVDAPDAGAPPEAPAVSEEVLTNNLAALQNAHPTYRADFLLASLEKCDMSLAETLAWLATVQDVKNIVDQMRRCFPTAKKPYVAQVTQDLGGDVSAVWAHLSQEFASPWATKFTSSSIQRDAVRDAQRREDNASEHSVILLASSGVQKFEKNWWKSYHASRRFRLGESSPHEASWDSVCEHAAVDFPVSPQFVKCVESLGMRHTNTALFKESVVLLRALPLFRPTTTALCRIGDSAPHIVSILVEDGLASPSAAAWLALNHPEHRPAAFSKYGLAHRSLIRSRDKGIRAWLSSIEKDAEEVIDLDIPTDDDTDMFDNVPGPSRQSGKGSARDTTSAKRAAMAAKSIGMIDTSVVSRAKRTTPRKSNTSANSAQKKKGSAKKAKPGKKK